MAVNAKFIADFSAFKTAVDQSVVKLRDFETGAAKVSTSLNKMANSLSGTKLIADATLMAAAVQKIGGPTKLTANELANMGAKAAEAVDKMKRLGLEVPPGLQNIANAAKSAETSTGGLGVSFGKLVGSFITAQAIIGTVKTAFHSLVGFVTDSVKAANDAEKAQVQLHAALRAQGTATPAVVAAFQRYGEELQRTTIYQDDAAAAAQALLVQVGNVMPRDMEKALQATANLASGLGIDLQTAALNVAKAAEGQTGALKKSGVVIDETKLKAEGFGHVLDAINAKFAGQSAAIAGTYQGRLLQLKNSWNDLQESVGRLITTNETLLTLFGQLNTGLGANKDALEQNRQAVNFVSDAVILTVKAFGMFGQALDFVQTFGNASLAWLREGGILVLEFSKKVLQASQGLSLMQGNFAAFGQARDQIAKINEAIKDRRDLIQGDIDRSIKWGNALQGIVATARNLEGQLAKTRGQTVAFTGATDAATDAWTRQTTASKVDTDAVAKRTKAAETFVAAMLREVEARKKVIASIRELEVVSAGLDGPIKGMALSGELIRVNQLLEQATIKLKVLLVEWFEVTGTISHGIGPIPGLPLLKGKDLIPDGEVDDFGQRIQLLTDTLGGLGAAWARVATQASAAITVIRAQWKAGDKWGAVGTGASLVASMTDPNTALGGAARGAAIGTSILPGWGTAIGAGVGAIAGMMGPSEADKVSKLRKEMIATFGTIEELKQQAEKAGVSLDRLMSTEKTKTFQREVDKLRKALDFSDAAMQTFRDTLAKYNIEIGEAGAAGNMFLLSDRTRELYQDMKVLESGQIGVAEQARFMQTALNGFVQDALRAGIAIPNQFKGIIQSLIDQGFLLDDNGKAYGSMEDAGITFGDTMQDVFTDMRDAIRDLSEAIRLGLGVGLSDAEQRARELRDELAQLPDSWIFRGPRRDALEEELAGLGGATGGLVTAQGIQHFGMGGKVLPFRGTDTVPAMLTPGEMVLNASQQRAVSALMRGGGRDSQGGGDRTIHVPVYLDGRQIADVVVSELPDALKRRGIAA